MMQMLTPVFPGYGSPHDSKDSSAQYLNYLRGFANPGQKKVTRGMILQMH